MVNVSVSTNQANIPIGFENDIIQAIQYETILQKTVTMVPWTKADGQTIVKNRGVNWTKQFKYPNTQITPNAYVQTSEFLYIDTFEVAALLLEDFGKLFIPDKVLADHATAMGYSLSKSVDVSIANLFQSFSQTVTGTAYNVPIIYPNLAAGSGLLTVGGVKPSDAAFTVISTQQRVSFKSSQVFTDSSYAGQEGINNFKKAMLTQNSVAGSTLLESSLLRAPSGGGHDNAMYSKDAIRLAFAQKPEMFEDFYGLDLGTVKGYKQAYGMVRSYRSVETAGSPALTDSWAVSLPGL